MTPVKVGPCVICFPVRIVRRACWQKTGCVPVDTVVNTGSNRARILGQSPSIANLIAQAFSHTTLERKFNAIVERKVIAVRDKQSASVLREWLEKRTKSCDIQTFDASRLLCRRAKPCRNQTLHYRPAATSQELELRHFLG